MSSTSVGEKCVAFVPPHTTLWPFMARFMQLAPALHVCLITQLYLLSLDNDFNCFE